MSDPERNTVESPDSEPSWTALAEIISDSEAEEMLAHQAEMCARSRDQLDRTVELLRNE